MLVYCSCCSATLLLFVRKCISREVRLPSAQTVLKDCLEIQIQDYMLCYISETLQEYIKAIFWDYSVIFHYGRRSVILWAKGAVVGIASGYGLDGLGIESRWGHEIIRIRPDRPWAPPNLQYSGYWISFPGGKAAAAWRWPPIPI
jgi:hypothetical protein